MGQNQTKIKRKSDLSNISKINFSEYFSKQGAHTSEDYPESMSPTLNDLNHFGYIKSKPINFPKNPNKLFDKTTISSSVHPIQRKNSPPIRFGLTKSNMTMSSSNLHSPIKEIKEENFQIKNIFHEEKFQKANEKKSFFKKLTQKPKENNESKISLHDMLNYKPGRRIFFTHTQQNQKNEMKNPFEEIRVPPLEKKISFFKDDMQIKHEDNDKITPEEKNLPSPYYKENFEKMRNSDEKIDILLDDTSDENFIDPIALRYKGLGDQLIEKVKEANESNLDGFDKIYEDYSNDYRLQIFMKTYVSKEKNRINIFRSQFIVPCSPEEFLRFMNDVPEQTKIDKHLDQFYIVKQILPNLNVVFLSYKKVLISSPRDLIYLKAIKQINPVKNIWCDASQSIEFEGFPIKNGIIRAEIILSGHMVCPMEENPRKSTVRLYSEVDFKTNVPIFLSKPFSINEMKTYTGECIKRIKEIKNE